MDLILLLAVVCFIALWLLSKFVKIGLGCGCLVIAVIIIIAVLLVMFASCGLFSLLS